jgi:anti-sigma regulatory factor (Ser/Thr protein kinase)
MVRAGEWFAMNLFPPRPDVVLNREYDGTTHTLRTARTDVVGCLNERGVDQDLQERAELVLSELASNAVQAAPGNPFSLRLALAGDGTLVLAVSSQTHNGGPPPRREWGPDNVLAPTGRGLMIVDQLAERVDVERPDVDRVVVTAILR